MEFFGPETMEEAARGLRCLVGGPERRAGEARGEGVEGQVRQFENYAAGMGIDVREQVMALEGGKVVGMCLRVASAGRTAMLFGPSLTEYPGTRGAMAACVGEALADARGTGVVMVQVMLDPGDVVGREVFAEAGLGALATLVYMERRPPGAVPAMQLPGEFRLESYCGGTHGAFRAAILGSYVETLDCPALSGMRDIEDVIAGHKAVGTFEPALWSVVMEGSRAVGCLLLAEIPARRALDLVYLGLAPEGRGRGVARALMQRVLGVAAERGMALTSLAVDELNVPALRLYKRFGYGAVARRLAMVRKLS